MKESVPLVMGALGRLLLSLLLLSWDGKLFQVFVTLNCGAVSVVVFSTVCVLLFMPQLASHCAAVSISGSSKVAMI